MPDPLAASATDLLSGGSLDMSPDRPGDAAAIAELLPAGTRVFVHHPLRHALAQSLDALARLREAGLEPVPHVAARRIAARAELEGFVERAVRDAAVTRTPPRCCATAC
jgi:methylenetetrahydrofolate reductase (NADPH)